MEPGARYFADENALGLAKVLIRAGRTDVVHPGHPALPDVPLGTLDLDWMWVGLGHESVWVRPIRMPT